MLVWPIRYPRVIRCVFIGGLPVGPQSNCSWDLLEIRVVLLESKEVYLDAYL